MEQVKAGLALCHTEILPITNAISTLAMDLIDRYALSHGLRVGDALIAATAQEHGLTVLSANVKHFGAVESLALEVFMP